MKKIFTLSLFVLGASGLFAQNGRMNNEVDVNPFGNSINHPNPQPQTPWQILFNYDLLAKTGANGNAAVCRFGTELWVSRWANDSLFRFDLLGNLLQRFTVSGVTGTRSLTTDGTNIYAGTNTSTVYKIDPNTKTLLSTITAPITNVRSLTYDPTTNSNAGGFWASTWNTDITQFDMSGTAYNLVAAASHGLTAMYGTAWDGTSPGGPYLWVFDQATSANFSDIVQVNIATGMQTGVIHNVLNDAGTAMNDTSGLAGGLFFNSTPPTLIGVLQGTPSNLLFAYDVTGASGVQDLDQQDFIGVYPNPTANNVNVHLNITNNNPINLKIMDVLGSVVFEDNTNGVNNYFDLSSYKAGVYFIKVTYEGKVYTSKLIKE